MSILADYEASGVPPAVEPNIPINGSEYHLAPHIEGTQTPRQLIECDKYGAWLQKHGLWENGQNEAFQVPHSTKSHGLLTDEKSKNQKTEKISEPF